MTSHDDATTAALAHDGIEALPPTVSALLDGPGGRRRTTAEWVTDRLVTAIAVGAYSPGEALPPERDLAKLLGVSRATLREGLSELVDSGLLESRRGRGGGTFVSTRSWRDVAPDAAHRTLGESLPQLRELFDYRCLVEGMIARTAAERGSPAERRELADLLAAFSAAGSMTEARALDARLHHAVTLAAHNPLLVSLSGQLTRAATLGLAAEPYPEAYFARALAEHTSLVEAVVAGDAERAGQLGTDHFRLTAEALELALHEVTGEAPPG